MSKGLNYFPPNGTKYKWWNKSLNHSPWVVRVGGIYYTQYVICRVDLLSGKYFGYVKFYSISGRSFDKVTRSFKNPLSALKASETIADKFLAKDTKPWMIEAIKNKWRPPLISE